VTFALLASLVCALTVVPVMASLFIDRIKLNPDEGAQHHDTFVQRIYTPLLRAALHNRRSRWAVIGISAVLVVFAGLLVPTSRRSSSTPVRRSTSRSASRRLPARRRLQFSKRPRWSRPS